MPSLWDSSLRAHACDTEDFPKIRNTKSQICQVVDYESDEELPAVVPSLPSARPPPPRERLRAFAGRAQPKAEKYPKHETPEP